MTCDNRVYLDNFLANFGNLTRVDLERIISQGMTIIVSETALDISIFQEYSEWFKEQLMDKHIVIELMKTPDEMTQELFYWSSCVSYTSASESFEAAIDPLPDYYDIFELAYLVEDYGIPKEEWYIHSVTDSPLISPEMANRLRIRTDATRADVIKASHAVRRMDLFHTYNKKYVQVLAKQHHCEGYINSNGTITSV